MEAQRDAAMALLSDQELPAVSGRLKALRAELARKEGSRITQYQLAERINVPPRTYQSWENAEVETEGENYGKIAAFYSRKLGRRVTKNFILYGQDTVPALPSPEATSEDNDVDAEHLEQIETRLADLNEKVDRIASVAEANSEILALLAVAQEIAPLPEQQQEEPPEALEGTGR